MASLYSKRSGLWLLTTAATAESSVNAQRAGDAPLSSRARAHTATVPNSGPVLPMR